MNESDFRQLKKYDLVILTDSGKVKAVLHQSINLLDSDLIICRVIEVASLHANPPKITVELRSVVTGVAPFSDKYKLKTGVKNKFDVGTDDVGLAPTPEQLIDSVDPTKITDLDREAIRDPGFFIRKKCGYRWLPGQTNGYPDTLSARDHFKGRFLSESGGMRALLEYRQWITERLLEDIVYRTAMSAESQRREQAMLCNFTPELTEKYLKAIAPFEGNAPGSTQPTSDIDVNTKGDGTEYAVVSFNSQFGELFDNNEPGIVFDVNLYAKDFLPRFANWPNREANQPVELIRPTFDHEFSDYKTELEDADLQLTNAFIKLRRYMPSREGKEGDWDSFTQWFKDKGYEKVKKQLADARDQHLKWATAIAQSYSSAAEPQKVFSAELPVELRGEVFLNRQDIDSAKLMKVQNRLYEFFLRNVGDNVEVERGNFNLLKFQQGSARDLDVQYMKLRNAMSRSLYFANEAYVTAGAVVQTVGGKQLKSRGVAPGYTGKQSFHNIAYTAHELMASVIDQLADIHKEAGRHFAHAPNDVGGALLGCGKYIHRMLNAVKHLYVLFDRAGVVNAQGAFPKTLFRDKEGWDQFRPLGFGLEASKKMKFDVAEWDAFKKTSYPIPDAVYQALSQEEGKKEESILSLLVNKFSQTSKQVNQDVPMALALKQGESLPSREAFILRIVTRAPFLTLAGLRLTEFGGSFFPFFDGFVVEVLKDYQSFRAIDFQTLQKNFPNDPERGPHFTLNKVVTDLDALGEEAEVEADEDFPQEVNEI